MSNFIEITDYDASIHREILDSLLRQGTADYDPQIVEICEDRAVMEMRSYLNKKYDCDKIFSARGTDRHALVLMFALDIATSSASTTPIRCPRVGKTATNGPWSGSRA